ncbi:MAG: hypothetical protein Q9180_002659, partial [Flavoplaca navasiana]
MSATRRIKDQMIEDEQERRERMHQAVDDIEAVENVPKCPYEHCDERMQKKCFIGGHFDWCLYHRAISVEEDGTYELHQRFTSRTSQGLEKTSSEMIEKRECSHPDVTEDKDCDVVES